MSLKDKIAALLAGGAHAAAEEERAAARMAARVAWVRRRIADLKAAQERVDAAWDRILADIPEDVSDEELEKLPDPQTSAPRVREQARQRRVNKTESRVGSASVAKATTDGAGPPPRLAEQAEFDAIYAEIEAVRDHDRGRGICIGRCSAAEPEHYDVGVRLRHGVTTQLSF